jgi:hypothetical protein
MEGQEGTRGEERSTKEVCEPVGEPVGEQQEQEWKVRMDALGPHLYPASRAN